LGDGRRTLRSAYSWATIGNFTKASLTFGLSIVLARLLDPADFGMVGIVLVFLSVLTVVQDMGFGGAVVYFDETPGDLATYYVITVTAGAVMTGLAVLSSPVLATFYDRPELTAILSALSLRLFLGGLRSVPLGLLRKQLRFLDIAAVEIVASVAAGVIAVVLAWKGAGVWSLVANGLAGATLQTLLMCRMAPLRWTLRPDRAVIRKALRWGLPQTGSTILWQAYTNVDVMIIGKMSGMASLGFYTYAMRLSRYISDQLLGVINQVSFPSFVSAKDDRPRLIRHWLSLVWLLALLNFPAAVAVALSAEDFVRVVLGEKWLPSAPLLRYLCFPAAVLSIQTTIAPLLSAQGRTDLNFRFSALNAVVVPVAVMTGCYLGGTHGVAIALCLVCPATAGYRLSMAVMVLREVSYTDFFRTLRSPVVIAAACVVVMLPFDWLMPSGLARLVVRSGVGMLCYCSCLIGVRSVREQLVHAAGPAAQQFLERLRPSRKNKS
jgi:O-antigen/teichoic acid export membrane protein